MNLSFDLDNELAKASSVIMFKPPIISHGENKKITIASSYLFIEKMELF